MGQLSETRRQHLHTSLLILVLVLPILEVLLLSQRFDAYTLVMRGEVSGWRSVFGYTGDMAKIAVLAIFTGLLLLHKNLRDYAMALHAQFSQRRFLTGLVPHLLAYSTLLYSTAKVFSDPQTAQALHGGWFGLWFASIIVTFITWLLLLTRVQDALSFLQSQRNVFIVAILVAFSIWALAMATRQFWGPMSELTFILAASLIYGLHPDLVFVDAESKLLGLGDFIVNIAPACSGYEGVGLVTAFTAIYLWVTRESFRFPRALLLFPIGAISIWLLNVVRIAVLIMIGHHWSPEVAVGGFHSQAGWLTFIVTSLAILWLAGESRFFLKNKPQKVAVPRHEVRDNEAIASLIPMLALLSIALLTTTFSAGFDWLYPLRVIAVVIALKLYWPTLQLFPWRWSLMPLAAGAVTAVIWVLMLGQNPESDNTFSTAISEAPLWLSASWLIFRFIGSTVTVPIAEELAFRGYLLCRFSATDVKLRGGLPFSVVGIMGSSIAFGALHGAWLAGTIAGVIYAAVRLRGGTVTDAIVAHSVTNALIFGYAAITGVWSVI